MRVFVAGYKGAGLGGGFIKWFTFGGFSHVSLVFDFGDGGMLEIDALQNRGVTQRIFGQLAGDCQLFQVPCTGDQAGQIYTAACKLKGCKYDWAGIYGFLRRKKRQNPNKWFCSELAAHCLELAGIQAQRLPAWKISPVMLCASPILKPVQTKG